jgi:hypothetical protein
MRCVDDIFEQGSCVGTGLRNMSGVKLTLIICSAISVLAAIGVIANFGPLTARIAILMAKLLSYGFPVLIAMVAVVYFIVRLKFFRRW